MYFDIVCIHSIYISNVFFQQIQLEKEALIKGVPVGHTLDIEIPPPRPKKKPSNPYPRKTSAGAPTSQTEVNDEKISAPVSSLYVHKTTLDLEKEPVPDEV